MKILVRNCKKRKKVKKALLFIRKIVSIIIFSLKSLIFNIIFAKVSSKKKFQNYLGYSIMNVIYLTKI